jgi:hypothetical protein
MATVESFACGDVTRYRFMAFEAETALLGGVEGVVTRAAIVLDVGVPCDDRSRHDQGFERRRVCR